MPNTVIKLKRSGTVSSAPVALDFGELALNYADGYLYYKAANGTIVRFASGGGADAFGTVNANGTLVIADAPGDILTLVPGNNITITGDVVSDRVNIGLKDSININGTAIFTGPFTINNGSGAGGSDEGGEIQLANAVTNSVLSGPIAIDIWQNRIRFFEVNSPNRGAFINIASASAGVGTDLLASASATDSVARNAAGAAFDKANAALPNTNGATFAGSLTVSTNLTADRIISTNNGNGENFRVGDDAWIGDTNVADTVRIKGQQNPANAYINFGNNDGVLLGRAGSGNLTYGGNTVWHSGIDGAGSGLDADLLDGQQGTYYATATDSTAAFVRANIAVANVNYVNTAVQAAFAQANNTGPGTNTYLLTVIAGANTAVGAGANAYAVTVGAGANNYLLTVIAGANAAVGTGANAYAVTIGTASNTYLLTTLAGANTAVGTGANAFATTAAAGANAYLLATVAAANVAVGSGANAFTSATIAGANTAVGAGANAYAVTVGAGANSYLLTTIAGANAAVGTGANTFSTTAAAGANAYLLATIAGANTAVGAGANAYAITVGAGANTYLLTTLAGANAAVGTGANSFTSATIAGANTAVGAGANNYANSTFVRLTAASQTITGDVTIVGNLNFSGNTSFSNVQSIIINDPLIYLAGNNTSDIVDIGFFGNYVNATGSNVHTGLYREHVDKMYYLFQGYDKLPDNNHIGALSNNMTLAVLNADLRTSNLSLGGVNAITWITASFAKANTFDNVYSTIAGANSAVGAGANTYLLTTMAGANAAVGAGANAYAAAATAGANAFTSSTIAGANTAVGAGANTYLLTTLAGANTAVGAGANAFSTVAAAGANTYLLTTLAGANTAVGAGANTVGSAAFIQANAAVINANLDSVNATRYVVFEDAVTGSFNRANVSHGLTYNPSTNTISTINAVVTGNVGIGTTTPAYKLEVNGSFAATTKSFVIKHPTRSDMKLRYGSLEGPENGVYVRGRSNTSTIELPDYWQDLVNENTITVNLTPIDKKQELYVKSISNNVVTVGGSKIPNYFYTVYAERKDVEKLIVEF